jgi:long-subunit acyl-CoA synthetase (AMP-forming)
MLFRPKASYESDSMKDSSPGVTFSLPYEIATVRPLRQTTPSERSAAACHRDAASLPPEQIRAALWTQIERVNGRLEHYEWIRELAVIDSDFPVNVRSINHFQKIKVARSVVAARYQREIDAIYSTAAPGGEL